MGSERTRDATAAVTRQGIARSLTMVRTS
jgi:hypothetical protein